jgi:hypothetical protein
MASLLIEARDAASAARLAGQSVLDAAVLDDLVTRYRALAGAGLAGNLCRRTATAKDARRLARRFLSFEDLILRFATRPDLDIFSNDLASHRTSRGRSKNPSRSHHRPGELCRTCGAMWGYGSCPRGDRPCIPILPHKPLRRSRPAASWESASKRREPSSGSRGS